MNIEHCIQEVNGVSNNYEPLVRDAKLIISYKERLFDRSHCTPVDTDARQALERVVAATLHCPLEIACPTPPDTYSKAHTAKPTLQATGSSVGNGAFLEVANAQQEQLYLAASYAGAVLRRMYQDISVGIEPFMELETVEVFNYVTDAVNILLNEQAMRIKCMRRLWDRKTGETRQKTAQCGAGPLFLTRLQAMNDFAGEFSYVELNNEKKPIETLTDTVASFTNKEYSALIEGGVRRLEALRCIIQRLYDSVDYERAGALYNLAKQQMRHIETAIALREDYSNGINCTNIRYDNKKQELNALDVLIRIAKQRSINVDEDPTDDETEEIPLTEQSVPQSFFC